MEEGTGDTGGMGGAKASRKKGSRRREGGDHGQREQTGEPMEQQPDKENERKYPNPRTLGEESVRVMSPVQSMTSEIKRTIRRRERRWSGFGRHGDIRNTRASPKIIRLEALRGEKYLAIV